MMCLAQLTKMCQSCFEIILGVLVLQDPENWSFYSLYLSPYNSVRTNVLHCDA